MRFPHDAAMDSLHGVAFDKGCYVGQEVVSRMRHRGTARRRIVALAAERALARAGRGHHRRRSARSAASAPPPTAARIGLVRLDRLRAALDEGAAVARRIGGGGSEPAVLGDLWLARRRPATAED